MNNKDDIQFNSVKQLYDRLTPALVTKQAEMRRMGISYIQKEDIWNYLKENKWKKAIDLSLYEMVSDVLNAPNELIELYVKEKLKERKRKPNLEEID